MTLQELYLMTERLMRNAKLASKNPDERTTK